MKSRSRLTSLFLLVSFSAVFTSHHVGLAQESKAEAILDLRDEIDSDIEFEVLRHASLNIFMSHPGVGDQMTSVAFYFSLPPFNEESHPRESPRLAKVQAHYFVAASVEYTIEYFFDEAGSLVLHSYNAKGYECGEKRYFFDDERLFRIESEPLEEDCVESEETTMYPELEIEHDFSQADLEAVGKIRLNVQEYKKVFALLFEVERLEKR